MAKTVTDQWESQSAAGRPRDGAMRMRRHGAELENALLQAAWDEVTAVGYAGLTMEGVAARAGTGKAVLYRRWPKRAELVLAAMRHQVGSIASQIPDTGDLREDVLIVLRQIKDRARQIGADVIHGLRMESQDLPPEVFAITPGVMMTLLTRAAERGDVQLEKVTPLIAALPGILIRHELMLSGTAVSEAYLTEIVDDVFLPLVTTAGRRASSALSGVARIRAALGRSQAGQVDGEEPRPRLGIRVLRCLDQAAHGPDQGQGIGTRDVLAHRARRGGAPG